MLISSVGKSLILSIFGVSHPTPRGVSQWYRLLKVKVFSMRQPIKDHGSPFRAKA
jgi:hypothetical protein